MTTLANSKPANVPQAGRVNREAAALQRGANLLKSTHRRMAHHVPCARPFAHSAHQRK
jgi:hypothetical protein